MLRMVKSFVLSFLFLTLCHLVTSAQKIAVLDREHLPIVHAYSYTLEDSSGQLSIEQIVKPYWQKQFVVADKNLDYNAHRSSAYWKKIEIVNKTDAESWVLEFPDPHVEHLQVYFIEPDGSIRSFQPTGFGASFQSRAIAHKNYVYSLHLGKGERMTIYARVGASNWFSSIQPNVRSITNFSVYFFSEYHFLGLYYGIILILIVYNFILGFFVHEKVHFYYCAYVICCGFYTYAEDGLAIQWLWPNLPYFNILLLQLAPILLLFSFLFYSDRFIDLEHHYPSARKYIWISALLYCMVYFIFLGYHKEIGILYITPFLIMCFSALKSYQRGYGPARFFLVGNSMIILSLVAYYARLLGWIPSTAFTVYLFNYAFVFEAMVLSIALADKVKTTKIISEAAQKETIKQLRINEELQQKVNKELESKVQERTKELLGKTQELTEANQKLENLKQQLYEMNSKMDINIWELKKEVKKETEARILNNVVSFEEFQAIFPDKKCYEYLKELKWKEGFVCPKCGNTKYGKGNNQYTYKCTQCQHQESVTSNTLFHALKFPISKAFYLAYFLTRNTSKLTYEEIGTMLDLNKNTVWNFDKKLKESSKVKGKANSLVPEWDKLLLARS